MKDQFAKWIQHLQLKICNALESVDGKAKFITDAWQRKEGGGGITKIIKDGAIFEKGGVNTSEVFGTLTPQIKTQLNIQGATFFACGISIVMHPYSPKIPTTHANYRYFEVYDEQKNIIDAWFGGGADLTPYYLDLEEAIHFHQTYKNSCDKFDANYYPLFKKKCDDYFVNHHRNEERRGIGGIFYDYQKADEKRSAADLFHFAQSNGQAFLDAYLPIVKKKSTTIFTPEEKEWQLIRRGRYVEFNLIHDRGTLFGLKSDGRTESILMSLPPEVKFEYQHEIKPASPEAQLIEILLQPIDWV